MAPQTQPDHSKALLKAVSFAVKKFSLTPDWEDCIDDVLEHLGKAADASRTYVYRNFTDSKGRLCQDLVAEWSAPGIDATIGEEWAHNWPYEDGYQHYVDVLGSGGVMDTRRSEVDGLEREDYEAFGVKSALFVPVFHGDEWWGYMGYEDCVEERTWTDTETDVIRTAAETLGGELMWSDLEDQVHEAEARWRVLVETIPAVLYIDRPGDELASDYVAPQIEAMLGITPEDWMTSGDAWERHLHPDDRELVLKEWREQMDQHGFFSQEYRMVRPDTEEIVWVRDDSRAIADAEGGVALIQGVMFDITKQKEAEEQVAFLAYHDALTKLANRSMFEEMLEPAMARARRGDLAVAVLFMDMDGFKEVNDTLGHDAGDELLRQVADRLVTATRETDLVARQGGDEFLVLLTDLEPGDEELGAESAVQVAEKVAERVHHSMRAPFSVAGVDVHASISVGISVFPFDATDARSLLKNADAAMYESKKSRPGSYAVHAQVGADPLTQMTFSRRLRRAVKNQAWVLHYQPSVELSTLRMVGVEALVRWRRPSGGLISPSEFLPIAEEMGLLEIIGDWVFEELCAQKNKWSEQGIDLDVSFNLSPRQLWQPDLQTKLVAGLEQSGIDPASLIVEVAESTAMTDPSRTQRILWGLHEAKLRVAIDDFGTGYTPPARIRHLPVDVLKIDQPLIRDLPDDHDVGSFVAAMVEFAKEVGAVSHAEGVETEAQRRFLMEKGCELGQGYLFSRPVQAEEITAMYRATDGVLAAAEQAE